VGGSRSGLKDFDKGLVLGFVFALLSLGWWGFSEGLGVVGGYYDWPFHVIKTDVWVTGDIFLSLNAVVVGIILLVRSVWTEKSSREGSQGL
jgi:hypothetical protein